MRKKLSLYAIGVVCIGLGFLLSIQFKSVTKNNITEDSTRARAEQLQLELDSELEKNQALYNQLIEYKDEIEKFRKEAEKSGGYAKSIAERLSNVEVIAGVTDIHGQGVVVTMKDSTKPANSGVDENYFVIHDEDILKVINELKAAGAEAISLNDERIISTSEIRCSGATVSVNGTKYAEPYIIKAIGDSETLERALLMRQGIVEVLTQWGIEINIKKVNDLAINGYSGKSEMKYAKPVER